MRAARWSTIAATISAAAVAAIPPVPLGADPKPQGTTTTIAGDAFGDGLPGPRATLAAPWGMAAGPDGIYISANGHHQVRVLRPNGVVDRVAGSSFGFSGDGGDATVAQLNRNRGLAFDREGRLLIADSGNSRIRRVDLATGTITTVAGNGKRTYAGDGGPARDASLAFPYDVAGDRFGNIYIADFENSRLRRVNAAGTIDTVAGTGNRDNPVDPGANDFDGVPASSASVKPTAVVTDYAGNVFLGDAFGCRVRRIDRATDIITTVAGGGCGYLGDGGAASQARFGVIHDLTFDPQGRLVIADADNNRIRRIEGDGTVATIVGDGTDACPTEPSPRGGPAGKWPIGVAYFDGALHYASNACGRAYRLTGDTIAPTVGRDGLYSGGSGDPATSINFTEVEAVAWGPDGQPYFGDTRGIWTVEPDGRARLVAGGQPGFADGPALEAKLRRVRGLSFDDDGALWIADLGNGRIRRLKDGILTTMAGNPAAEDDTIGTDGPALGVRLQGVIDVVAAPDGSVYFNEATEIGGRVRLLKDGRVTVIAGARDDEGRYLEPIGDGGPSVDAIFRYPRGLTLAPDGSLLVVDSQHHRIRRIVPGGVASTFAGDGGEASRGDGTIADLASLSSPEDVAIDPQGNVYVTDGKNEYTHQSAQYVLRRIAPNRMVSRIAGTGASGGDSIGGTASFSGRGGSGPALQFPLTNPAAVAWGPKGLLVADSTSVRLIRSPAEGWPAQSPAVRCDPYFPDVDGDADTTILSVTADVNQPWLDLLDADVASDGTTLSVTIDVLDLNQRTMAPPTAELGTAWAWAYRIKVGAKTVYLAALAPYGPPSSPAPAFEYGDSSYGRGSTSYTLTRRGAATGTFDMATDRITMSVPLAALGLKASDRVIYHEMHMGRLVEVAASRFLSTDDTTIVPGFLPGTTRSYTFDGPCRGGSR